MVDYVKCYTAEIVKFDESDNIVLSFERDYEHEPTVDNLKDHMADCATEFPEFADHKAQIFITQFYDVRTT